MNVRKKQKRWKQRDMEGRNREDAARNTSETIRQQQAAETA